MRTAVFLDRDNTLIKDEGFFHDPDGIEFLPGVVEGMRVLQDAGHTLISITNQSGIGRGYFSEGDALAVNQRMTALFAAEGVTLAKVYYCPHTPEAGCPCRKPKPLLILQAAEEFGIHLAGSFFIGDHPRDMEAGRAAGTRTILLTSAENTNPAIIDFSTDDFVAAAQWIIATTT